MNNFLATGGDGFTVFNEGTDSLGGAQDIDALVAYFGRQLAGVPCRRSTASRRCPKPANLTVAARPRERPPNPRQRSRSRPERSPKWSESGRIGARTRPLALNA